MESKTAELIEEHVPLADLIALEYANIPGCQVDDARSEAYLALMRAAGAFDAERGEFVPLASRAIRNRLNSLYAKQLRLAKLFPKSLDDPVDWGRGDGPSFGSSSRGMPDDPKTDVIREVRRAETATALAAVVNLLSPRERVVIDALRAGKTYSEMAAAMGMTKQAAHKAARGALGKLRAGLERLGYRGLATDGGLGSAESKKGSASV